MHKVLCLKKQKTILNNFNFFHKGQFIIYLILRSYIFLYREKITLYRPSCNKSLTNLNILTTKY